MSEEKIELWEAVRADLFIESFSDQETAHTLACKRIAKLESLFKEYGDGGEFASYEEILVENVRVRKLNSELETLVLRAATDSTVTHSDGPGCFYCDRVEHSVGCPAKAVLGGRDDPN